MLLISYSCYTRALCYVQHTVIRVVYSACFITEIDVVMDEIPITARWQLTDTRRHRYYVNLAFSQQLPLQCWRIATARLSWSQASSSRQRLLDLLVATHGCHETESPVDALRRPSPLILPHFALFTAAAAAAGEWQRRLNHGISWLYRRRLPGLD